MKDILKVFNEQISKKLKLNYCFMEYTKKNLIYPYLVGEYIEEPFEKESSHTKGTLIITAFTRDRESDNKKIKGTMLELEDIADKIKEHFKYFSEEINGSIVCIEYDYRQLINSEDPSIKKLEIYLQCNKWKGD